MYAATKTKVAPRLAADIIHIVRVQVLPLVAVAGSIGHDRRNRLPCRALTVQALRPSSRRATETLPRRYSIAAIPQWHPG